MKEAQGQHASAVGQVTEQEATATAGHFAAHYFRLDLRLCAGLQTPDRGEAGAILIAQRQMQQYIHDGADAQPEQAIRQFRPDAFQGGDGRWIRHRRGSQLGDQTRTPILDQTGQKRMTPVQDRGESPGSAHCNRQKARRNSLPRQQRQIFQTGAMLDAINWAGESRVRPRALMEKSRLC